VLPGRRKIRTSITAYKAGPILCAICAQTFRADLPLADTDD
jgi:hypothetical protein